MSMIDAGAGLVVGTVAADGEPRAARAWSAEVIDPAERRLRISVGADDPITLANLGSGSIALTGADVRTFRAVQMKGRVLAVEEPTAADLELVHVQSERFFRAVHETDGNPVEHLRRLLPVAIVAVEVLVDELFDQTPGPAAGAPLVER
jgi:hypothetical protein